ncbi:MAG: PAS domain S-box protein [Polyangiaceae bacterium]
MVEASLRATVEQLERKLVESEGRLRTVIANAPLVLFAFDCEGTYTLYEGKGVESLNRDFEGPIGRSVFETFGKLVGAEPAIRRALAGELTRWEGDTRGGFYEATLIPVFDPAGAVVSVTGLGIDVSARKHAEASLRASESRFRAMIEKSHDAITLIDATGTILYVSPAMERISGRPSSELTGASTFDFVHPDDRARLHDVFSRVLANPSSTVTCEFRALHTDGTLSWMEATGTNLLDDPMVGAIVSNFRDITQRILSDSALRESQRRLEEAQAIGHLGSWVSGAGPDEPVTWSAECARLFERAQSSPPTVNEFLQLVHPADRARIVALSEAAIPDGPPCDAEYRIFLSTGEVRWLHGKWAIEGATGHWANEEFHLDPGGRGWSCRIAGVVQDITDRKRGEAELRASENRYRRIVENTSEGIWMYDIAGVTTFMNPRMAEMLGYSADELVGRPIFALMQAAEIPGAQARLARRRRGIKERGEFRLQRRDGTELLVSLHTTPLQDDAGDVESVLALVTDITEQRKSQAALQHSAERLRQAQKMEAVGSLAGGVAHDFNNLLSVILSYTDLAIADLKVGDPLRADLEEVHKAGLRAGALTRQLLAFSRQQVLQPAVIDVNEVVGGVEKMLGRLLGEDIELSWIMSPAPVRVHADPGQIEQVLMNLVVNARDAMPNGGNLTIETAGIMLTDADAALYPGVIPGPHVLLAVTDTGVGMDAATQARIFDPFFTTKEKGKGTGLGLSTVYGIVKQSEGNICVTSEVGAGTTFKVYLPQTERTVISQAPPAVQTPTRRGTETTCWSRTSRKYGPSRSRSCTSRVTTSSRRKTPVTRFWSASSTASPFTSCSPTSSCRE